MPQHDGQKFRQLPGRSPPGSWRRIRWQSSPPARSSAPACAGASGGPVRGGMHRFWDSSRTMRSSFTSSSGSSLPLPAAQIEKPEQFRLFGSKSAKNAWANPPVTGASGGEVPPPDEREQLFLKLGKTAKDGIQRLGGTPPTRKRYAAPKAPTARPAARRTPPLAGSVPLSGTFSA